jgi:CBS domain-containing protein
MSTADSAIAGAQVAADLMLREPKTLPGDATVAQVGSVLANPKVQMVLLADGTVFRGAVTSLPADAPQDVPAVDYADANPDTMRPDEPAAAAFERANASPYRRVIVLGDDGTLLGLLCLNVRRTGFCKTASRAS